MFLLTFHHPTWSHLVAGGRPELQPLDPRKEGQRVFPMPPADGPGTPARHNSTELLQMRFIQLSFSQSERATFDPTQKVKKDLFMAF